MATVVFKVNGLEEISKKLRKNMNLSLVNQVVRNNTDEMTLNAKRLAPTDTNNLKTLIHYELKNGGLVGVVTSPAPYSGYQEFGTRKMRKWPYMKPSFEKQKVKFKSDLMRLAK